MSACGRWYLASLIVAVLLTPSLSGQVSAEKQLMTRSAPSGTVLIDKSQPHWSSLALESLAARAGKLLVYCTPLDATRVPGHAERVGSLEVPAGIAGIKQFATAAGFEVLEHGPYVLLLKSREGSCGSAMVVFTEEVKVAGREPTRAIGSEELELKLMQTAPVSERDLGPALHSPTCFGTYYWPAAGNDGRTLYVLHENSSSLGPKWPPQRRLRKVAVTGTGLDTAIGDIWTDRGQPAARYIEGPVANVEVDFDGDGLPEVVVFSGMPNMEDGYEPLHVLSGKTGEEIGTLAGYEFAVVRGADGRTRVRTYKSDGYREYSMDEGGRLKFLRLEESGSVTGPTGGRTSVQSSAPAGGAEQLIDHFVMPRPPRPIDPAKFAGIRKLEQIGRDMVVRRGSTAERAGHERTVYLDYIPPAADRPGTR